MEAQDNECKSIVEQRERERDVFHQRFQRTLACQLLTEMEKFNAPRVSRLEHACWDFRCAESRRGLKHGEAERALATMQRLRHQLGDPSWLDANEAAAIDLITGKLRTLASSRERGRRRDTLGQTFRRNMRIFFAPAIPTRSGCRVLTQQEKDEILSDLFGFAMGRTISTDSYVRMRKREQAAEKREVLESRKRAANPSLRMDI